MLKSILPTNRAAWLLLLALLCCVLEGAIRKWMVGDQSLGGRLAYLSKDIVFVFAAISMPPVPNAVSRACRPFLAAGLFLLGIGALVSVVSGLSIIGAILSVKTFFVLPFAAWLVSQCIPPDTLQRAGIWISLLAIPIAGLATVQFISPPSSSLNRYSTEGEYVSTSGFNERVRATGTFSYITGLSNFSVLAVWAGIATISLAKTNQEQTIGILGVGAGFCCGLATVSRAAPLFGIWIVLAWTILGGGVTAKLKHAATAVVVLTLLVMFAGWQDTADELVQTVQTRAARSSDGLASRFRYDLMQPIYALERAPLGDGFGMQQAGREAPDGSDRASSAFEGAWGRTIMEVGASGFIGAIVLYGLLIVPARTVYFGSCDPPTRTVAAITCAAGLAYALPGFQFNHVSAFMFWFLTALMMAFAASVPEVAVASSAWPAHSPGSRDHCLRY